MPAFAKFLSVAHTHKLLTRLQANAIIDHQLWLRDNGFSAEETHVGDVGIELGIFTQDTVSRILSLCSTTTSSVEDVIYPYWNTPLSPVLQRCALAVLLGITAVLFMAVGYPADAVAIVHATLWICTEAFLTAGAPRMHTSMTYRLPWSTLVRWLLRLVWCVTLSYCVYCYFALRRYDMNHMDRLMTRLATSGFTFAAASVTIVITSEWRRIRLNMSNMRSLLMARILHECQSLRQYRMQCAQAERPPHNKAVTEQLSRIMSALARLVSCNAWVRFVSTLAFWKKDALRAVTVVYLRQGNQNAPFIPRAIVCPGSPPDVGVALEDIRQHLRPVRFDQAWFDSVLADVKNQKDPIGAFREHPDRNSKVSFTGAVWHRRAVFVSRDIDRCRTFDGNFVVRAVQRAHITNNVHKWLDVYSAIGSPVPPCCSTEQDQKGVLLVLTNVANSITREDRCAVVAVARAIALALD